jgi:site-specific recombinase XerD
MNLTYKLQGTKTIKKLSIRFYHNKLDISVAMTVMLMDHEWDGLSQQAIGNDELNIALLGLKMDVLKQYNKDFCKGVVINKLWLQKVVKTSFMRPKLESGLVSPDYTIFVSDFALWWLDNHSKAWKVSHKKLMDDSLKNQYAKFVKILKEYETVISEKLQLRNVMISDLNSFVDYLEVENYQVSTIERHIGRFRFFMNRASEYNIEVNQSFKQRIYLDKEDDFEGIYLNEVEIQSIIDEDFSNDYELNIAKQNLLIGLHTGLRVSDFLKLDTSNITDGVIKIRTKKTNAKVVIPVHPVVKSIIDSNFGNLPPKISSSDFNKHIKTICQVCKIDNVIHGKLFDKDLKRKKNGYFEKYKLISSHVCRRSFATLNYNKVSKEVLNAVCGWSKNSNQVEHYNKTSKLEYANIMQSQWNQ